MPFGIDFGTTNSAVVWDGNTLLDTGQEKPYPSVVAIDKATGKPVTGREAREQRERLEQEDYVVVTSVKKYLGRPISWRAGGVAWTPRMVATELFKGLKEHVKSRAELTRHTALKEAVVSIPVGFNADRRKELRAAALDAGIGILDFISEPTAAFLHCRKELPGVSSVAVFDWGGGTLDVSVLEIDGRRVRELATEGLERAGDDIDRRIAQEVHNQIVRGRLNTNVAFEEVPAVDAAGYDRLLIQAERAKIELSLGQRDKVGINLPSYLGSPAGVDIDRQVFTALISSFIDEATATLRRAIKRSAANSRAHRGDVDAILLVGGSSQLLGVYDRLDEMYPARVQRAERPDWSVGQGASELARRPGYHELISRPCLVLCDGVGHDLVPPRASFNGETFTHRLAVVEETDAAQLLFAERADDDEMATDTSPRLTQIGSLSVPVMGFDGEPFQLDAHLSRDITLEVAAKSLYGNGEDQRSWTYDRLRFSYVLPD
jgi:molecular chaperone DnaK